MQHNLMSHNFIAILVSAIVYSFIGWAWFSSSLGKTWLKEVSKYNPKVKVPTKKEMPRKLLYSFLLNLVTVLGVSFFVQIMGTNDLLSAIYLGLVLGICILLAPVTCMNYWEKRPFRLTALESGRSILGIVVVSIILSLWA